MENLRLCRDCKHHTISVYEEPCSECIKQIRESPKWEPKENVDHPAHYNQGKFECIEVMLETFGKEATQQFCLFNAFKYIWRTGEKNGAEDVKKARWYLDKFLELEGEADE